MGFLTFCFSHRCLYNQEEFKNALSIDFSVYDEEHMKLMI